METNKRTKIAAGVLTLAVGALCVDRFMSGPASASAAVDPASPLPAPKPTEPGPEPAAQSRGALADRLNLLRAPLPDQDSRYDAFVPPPEWFPAPVLAAAPKPENKAEPKEQHQLKSLVQLNGRIMAVIDGHTLVVPDASGMTKGAVSEFQCKNSDGSSSTVKLLSAVSPDEGKGGSATIEVDGQQVELKLKGGSKPDAKPSEPQSAGKP